MPVNAKYKWSIWRYTAKHTRHIIYSNNKETENDDVRTNYFDTQLNPSFLFNERVIKVLATPYTVSRHIFEDRAPRRAYTDLQVIIYTYRCKSHAQNACQSKK